MIPAERRLPEAPGLIDQLGYFVVHAPRQTGKTTALRLVAGEERPIAFPTPKGSGSVTSFSQADGFLEIDALVGQLLASSRLEFAQLNRSPLEATELARKALDRAGAPAELLQAHGGRLEFEGDPTLLSRALASESPRISA